jgi:HD-like signal output (HDOD) protein
MTEQEVFRLLKKRQQLPTLPQVLADIIRTANLDDTTLGNMARIISKDPSLTTKLLRMANSPFYAGRSNISTIQGALKRVGFRGAVSLALSTYVYGLFANQKHVINPELFWRHSLETAIASRTIAKACEYLSDDEAFVLGLLHDIGLLVLETRLPNEMNKIWKRVQTGENLIDIEQDILGTNHARVGQFLLDFWKLPGFMGEAIAQHHDDPSETRNEPPNRLGQVVNLANNISQFRCHKPANDELKKIDTVIAQLSASLNIPKGSLPAIKAKTMALLREESEILKIKIGSISELLKEANRLLYELFQQTEKVLRETTEAHDNIAREKVKEKALEASKTITATFAHYINNMTSSIMGGAQWVELAISKGKVTDDNRIVSDYIKLVTGSVEKITGFIEQLNKMDHFTTTRYTEEAEILDISKNMDSSG